MRALGSTSTLKITALLRTPERGTGPRALTRQNLSKLVPVEFKGAGGRPVSVNDPAARQAVQEQINACIAGRCSNVNTSLRSDQRVEAVVVTGTPAKHVPGREPYEIYGERKKRAIGLGVATAVAGVAGAGFLTYQGRYWYAGGAALAAAGVTAALYWKYA